MVSENDIASQMSAWWLYVYYAATYIIAVIAIVSLYISIQTSGKVSQALEAIQRGLVSITNPLIKYTGHKWLMDTNGITCKSPPIGILISYKNVSNVPVIIENTKFKVFYGEKEFDDIVSTTKHEEDNDLILSSGEILQSGTTQPELFQKYLSIEKNPMQSPNIMVEFWHILSLLVQIKVTCIKPNKKYFLTVSNQAS